MSACADCDVIPQYVFHINSMMPLTRPLFEKLATGGEARALVPRPRAACVEYPNVKRKTLFERLTLKT